MIDHIKVGGPWVEVTTVGGSLPYMPASSNPMHGAVRVVNGQQEFWNGAAWMVMQGGSVTINLTKRAEAIMDWADKKIAQEHKAEELAKTKPAVADALAAAKHAQDQLDIILLLTEENK